MNENMDQILEFLNIYLQSKLAGMKISEMKWDLLHYSYQESDNIEEYDDFKLEEFIILYKIDRLIDLNIINEKIGKKLKDIFYLKKELENKLLSLVSIGNFDNNKELINDICKKIKKIDEKLNKYKLINNKLDLKKIIDNNIFDNHKDYLYKTKKDINDFLANREDREHNNTINYLDRKIEDINNKTR